MDNNKTLRNNLTEQQKATIRDMAFARITSTVDKLDLSIQDLASLLGCSYNSIRYQVLKGIPLDAIVKHYLDPVKVPTKVAKAKDTLVEYLQQFTTEEEKRAFLEEVLSK